jgi:hypothetical protein
MTDEVDQKDATIKQNLRVRDDIIEMKVVMMDVRDLIPFVIRELVPIVATLIVMTAIMMFGVGVLIGRALA